MFDFDNSYAKLPTDFYQVVQPTSAFAPELIAFNRTLAAELGADVEALGDNELAEIFSGKKLLPGSKPIALAYAGHQFGNFVPSLGDGRAVLLGEIVAPDGNRYDIQLKGSGQTSFSRRGDGRSALGPVIREYILCEAMNALNIPTTRALAAVTSGENVRREAITPGGIFTRVASSHIRIGTFEYFACRKDSDAIKQLADYTINRHYPELNDQELNDSENKYFEFFKAVSKRKLSLVAQWMSVGFIHGVMNTDNSSICGETIDFGPCAFMDNFRYDKVFSSIDRDGRYAYHNQGNIALWNLSSLAHCLTPLISSDATFVENLVRESLEQLSEYFMDQWTEFMGKKLGIFSATQSDQQLIHNWLLYLEKENLDFTNSFQSLIRLLDNDGQQNLFRQTAEFEQFHSLWRKRINEQQCDSGEVKTLMSRSNPVFIPRNHQVEKAISHAVDGNYEHFHKLNQALAKPFTYQEQYDDFINPPKEEEIVHQTFCGT